MSGIRPDDLAPARVRSEFRRLVAGGARILPAGRAKADPSRLLSLGYTPGHRLRLFSTTYHLGRLRQDRNFRFFVAFVLLDEGRDPLRSAIYPRIFYKDSSLVWRSATHFIHSRDDNWIGKGALRCAVVDGELQEFSAEETTNLPLEIQAALDAISRRTGRVQRDDRAVGLVLRRAPHGRMEPYRDFSAPRQRASADPRNRIHRGEPVARFTRRNDPSSLRFVAGFEPDLRRGLLEVSALRSRLYGGEVRKYRILSSNRRIQYQFVAGPRQVWIIPPQALTTEISSYGVRTVDVLADEDLFVPGYEYHYLDESEDPPQLHTQIPEGFAGAPSEVDPSRADASAWLEAIPVIQEFRERMRLPLRRRPTRAQTCSADTGSP